MQETLPPPPLPKEFRFDTQSDRGPRAPGTNLTCHHARRNGRPRDVRGARSCNAEHFKTHVTHQTLPRVRCYAQTATESSPGWSRACTNRRSARIILSSICARRRLLCARKSERALSRPAGAAASCARCWVRSAQCACYAGLCGQLTSCPAPGNARYSTSMPSERHFSAASHPRRSSMSLQGQGQTRARERDSQSALARARPSRPLRYPGCRAQSCPCHLAAARHAAVQLGVATHQSFSPWMRSAGSPATCGAAPPTDAMSCCEAGSGTEHRRHAGVEPGAGFGARRRASGNHEPKQQSPPRRTSSMSSVVAMAVHPPCAD